MYKIILASGSPRRKEILEQMGVTFSIKTSDLEEVTDKIKPDEMVMDLAFKKAYCVAVEEEEEAIVIGADTLVSIDGQALGKPENREEARQMLLKLQGNKHQVYTGVALIKVVKGYDGEKSYDGKKSHDGEKGHTGEMEMIKLLQFAQESNVWVYHMKKEQIEAYIETGEPFDKAGGYGIQGKFAIHIEKIEGDYNNIVGFPAARLYQELLKLGIDLLQF